MKLRQKSSEAGFRNVCLFTSFFSLLLNAASCCFLHATQLAVCQSFFVSDVRPRNFQSLSFPKKASKKAYTRLTPFSSSGSKIQVVYFLTFFTLFNPLCIHLVQTSAMASENDSLLARLEKWATEQPGNFKFHSHLPI